MIPLTPPDCDLRNFPYLPLDVIRLRDSDLAALESAEAFRAAVLLWCASWHQIPAASLPDDDRVLANLSGFGRMVKDWLKVRDGALRGWVKCDDGRLYHPVLAEKALSSLESKYKKEWQTELARIRKHNQRHPDNKLKEIDYDDFMSIKTSVNCPIGHKEDGHGTSYDCQHPTEHNGTEQNRTDISHLSNTQDNSNRVEPTKAASVCIAISAIYKKYNQQPIDIAQHNPLLTALIEAGATVGEFEDSAEAAMLNPARKGFSWILGRVKGQREQAAQANIVQGDFGKKTKPWFFSSVGIEEKGKELGINYLKDEQFPSYKSRVYLAAGLTDEDYAKAKADWEGKRA
jgi:hypothetical protein